MNRYKAWSSIVVSLIPNVSALKMHLQVGDVRPITSKMDHVRCMSSAGADPVHVQKLTVLRAVLLLVCTRMLQSFASIMDADEVVLFERATFLVIASSTLKQHHDPHRFEKISNIVKQVRFQSFSVFF